MQKLQRYYMVYTYHAQTLHAIKQAMRPYPQYQLLQVHPPQIDLKYIIIFIQTEDLPRTTLDLLNTYSGLQLVLIKNINSLKFELFTLQKHKTLSLQLTLNQVLQFHKLSIEQFKKLLHINNSNEEFFIPLSKILFLKADNNYAQLFLSDNTYLQAFTSLKIFEHRLPDYFLRTHKSYLVNTSCIYRIRHHKREIHFQGQEQVARFAKSKKPQIIQLIQMLKLITC